MIFVPPEFKSKPGTNSDFEDWITEALTADETRRQKLKEILLYHSGLIYATRGRHNKSEQNTAINNAISEITDLF